MGNLSKDAESSCPACRRQNPYSNLTPEGKPPLTSGSAAGASYGCMAISSHRRTAAEIVQDEEAPPELQHQCPVKKGAITFLQRLQQI